MTDTALSQMDCFPATGDKQILQEYIHALLARQQALDLLDMIQQQISHVWSSVRRLLGGAGSAVRATQSIRVARVAQAAQAQYSYRSLEKRREECIASLQQAELRANAALQQLMIATIAQAGKKTSSRTAESLPASRRKVKTVHSVAI
jgi:hypothetical protein